MGLIAIDFDHTINNNHDIEEGERYSKPFTGARTILQRLKLDGHNIIIFSCNRKKWIEEWMNHWNLPYDYIWEGDKPVYDALIDDRAVGFRGKWDEAYNEVQEIIKGYKGSSPSSSKV